MGLIISANSFGIVLQVRVLDRHDLSRYVTEPGPEGRPLAPVPVVKEELHPVVKEGLLQEFPRPVGGAVIDDQDLPDEIEFQDLRDDVQDRRFLVVHRDDDGQHLFGIHFTSGFLCRFFPFAGRGFICGGAGAVTLPGERSSGVPAIMKTRRMTLGHNCRKRRFSDVMRW